jgi:squalene-hopene/tetraprenyl-beta-curcumene cyclase
MNTTRVLLSTILGGLGVLGVPGLPASPAAAQDRIPGYLTLERLKDEIGVTVRWMRAQQDPLTGAYGNVEETCWALRTFAASPWRYGYDDGPFVSRAVDHLLALQQPNGAIFNPGASRLIQHVQTSACSETLVYFQDVPKVAAAWKACQTFAPAKGQATWAETFAGVPEATLFEMAEDQLAPRRPEGWWRSKLSVVKATGMAVDKLSGLYGLLEASAARAPKASHAATPLPAFTPADRGKAEKALARGAAFLASQGRNGRWGFDGRADPGITAMVVGGLLAARSADGDEAVRAATEAGLDWLVSLQHEDGSIHAGQYANYVTSAAIMALVRAGREKDAPVIAKARAFLQVLQSDEGEGYQGSDHFYGGVGYGGDERPDLSNLQMALDALHSAGVEPGDPTMQKALEFLQRCQNRSESNDLALQRAGGTIKSGDDGGAGYAPGESKAGMITLADGSKVPRSYGSMTYALLKGYLFAGLPKDDPRVAAAWAWLSKNYTLDVNPGFEASSDPTAPYQGLFYYFHTMARALDLYGSDVVLDAAGTQHAWRGEMVGRIAAMQRADGSWVNTNAERWYEGNPVLATAYALMTLDAALPASR